ncbi:hypothetical protein HZA86_01130 [Candidatus Uhrbacteria bacterium]|nr:hypothetical protein [Candidatus Uhrbacteria bacterium]
MAGRLEHFLRPCNEPRPESEGYGGAWNVLGRGLLVWMQLLLVRLVQNVLVPALQRALSLTVTPGRWRTARIAPDSRSPWMYTTVCVQGLVYYSDSGLPAPRCSICQSIDKIITVVYTLVMGIHYHLLYGD